MAAYATALNLKQLESALSAVESFPVSSVQLEQYITPPHLAARVVHTAHAYGDIEDRSVLDLGCGTGMLAIACALAGAASVVGVEVDAAALEVAARNAERLGVEDVVDFVLADVSTLRLMKRRPQWGHRFHTVCMNPPFGTRRKGADAAFVAAALEMAGVAYSLHKSSTRAHLARKFSAKGATAEPLAQLKYNLAKTHVFHTKKQKDIEVDLIRFVAPEPEAPAPEVAEAPPPAAAAMDATYAELAARARAALAEKGGEGQLWIGLAGPPGAGKSTLSAAVARLLGDEAVVVPMDGYHYSKAQLSAMPDSDALFARRGARWTFDARALVDDLARIKADGAGAVPSFDHGRGDPVEGDIRVSAAHRIVIVEGNYLLLRDEPVWGELWPLFDDTWFVDVALDDVRARLVKRHMAASGEDAAACAARAEANDVPNAAFVLEAHAASPAARVVRSLDTAEPGS